MLFCFFFQAEDGIRDAQESRGLGDVYKRQHLNNELNLLGKNKIDKKNIVGAGFIINLPDLKGNKKLEDRGVKIHSLMDF